MRTTGHIPTRTCVACRSVAPQAELLRMRVRGCELAGLGKGEGRGVYVHPETSCLTRLGRDGVRAKIGRCEAAVVGRAIQKQARSLLEVQPSLSGVVNAVIERSEDASV